jgi:hypothetical protein
MAAPNIVNVSSITGSTAVQAIGTSATAIVTNASASNKVYKINTLIVSNVDGTNNAAVNVDLYRSSTAYHIAKTIVVPADASIDILNKAIYLEEGDALRLTADTASRLEGVCSYEIIDDA